MNANEMTCDLRMVRTQDIRIDESYQRPLDLGRVKGIAAALKVGALGSVSLSRRQDGRSRATKGRKKTAMGWRCASCHQAREYRKATAVAHEVRP